MKTVLLLYPHQLFAAEHLPKVDAVYVVEEPLYFGSDEQYPALYHKQKLVLHRAGLRRYVEEVLWPNNFTVEYFDIVDTKWTGEPIVHAVEQGFEHIYVFDPADDILEKRLSKTLAEQTSTVTLELLPSPGFYLNRKDIDSYFGGKQQFKFADFYQWQRERFNILIDDDFRPVGGKWTYDTEKREKLSSEVVLPGMPSFGSAKHVSEAIAFVTEHFPGNPGSLESFMWPTSHDEATVWLNDFLQHRFASYGTYQDAISNRGVWLFHGMLSVSLNCGLLTPKQVVEAALRYAAKHDIPLVSVEGFIQQLIGWREYVRALYVMKGAALRTSNVFKHERKLTGHWYSGTTGLPPLDDTIKKAQNYGYATAVERLMVVGNAMLLAEIHPTEVYKWFAELFVDAYDWVLVPNVYGISQFASSDLMVAKPAISASNYILSMSDYDRGEWSNVWDGLYWRFVDTHRNYFSKNPRIGGVLLKRYETMDPARRRIIGYRANDFLDNFTA